MEFCVLFSKMSGHEHRGRRQTRSSSKRTTEKDGDPFKLTTARHTDSSDEEGFKSVDEFPTPGLGSSDSDSDGSEKEVNKRVEPSVVPVQYVMTPQASNVIMLTSSDPFAIQKMRDDLPAPPPLPPKPVVPYREFYSTVSKKYPERADSVRNAIKNFELSREQYDAGWRINETVTELRSVLYHYGVSVHKHDDPGVQKWFCLAENCCREDAKDMSKWYSHKNHTNAGRSHLVKKHKVGSEKTKLEDERKDSRNEVYAYLTQSNLYTTKPERFCLLMFTLYIVLNCIPFNNCIKPISRMFFALVCVPAMPECVSVKRVIHHLVELYAFLQNLSRKRFKKLKESSWIPLYNLNIDMWTSKKTGRKFLGVRIFYVNMFFQLETKLLAVREFNPSYEVKSSKLKQADLIEKWTLAVLKDYGLEAKDFYSGTTDAGSDVKCTVLKKLQIKWEWCPPHQVTCGVKAAIVKSYPRGTPVQKFEIQILLDKMKASVRKIKEVEKAGTLFSELMRSSGSKKLLKTFKSHRFLGAYEMVERYLESWSAAKGFHMSTGNKHFPLSGLKDTFHQLCSILHPLSRMTKEFQTRKMSKGWAYVIEMCTMREEGVLNKEMPVQKYDCEDATPYQGPLDPVVQEAQNRLIDALDKKFFIPRYVAFTLDILFDCQLYLHPGFKGFDYAPMLEIVMREAGGPSVDNAVADQVALVQGRVKCEIIRLAEIVCERQNQRNAVPTSSEKTSKYEKMRKKHAKGSGDSLSSSITQAVRIAVRKEIEMWEEKDWYISDMENPLEAWHEIALSLPILSNVARTIFGVATSACVLESDFGTGELFLTGNRSSMSAETVEMGLTAMRTPLEDIDIVQIPVIKAEDLHRYKPTHPMVALELTSGDVAEEEEVIFYQEEDEDFE